MQYYDAISHSNVNIYKFSHVFIAKKKQNFVKKYFFIDL